jgi:hypothetical protein
MARAHTAFLTAFQDAVRPSGALASLDTNADLKALMLRRFNRSYEEGYNLPVLSGHAWEDARTGAMITPVAGLIAWDVLGDARGFEVWDKDPRYAKDAERVFFATDPTGIRVGESSTTPVWVSWVPEVVQFTLTKWATGQTYEVGDVIEEAGESYRCLVGHTSGTFSTDLGAGKWILQPVLRVLSEFVIEHVEGLILREGGEQQTGYQLQSAALKKLREKFQAELRRNLNAET